jgi:predicted nucleic acid-binding protein
VNELENLASLVRQHQLIHIDAGVLALHVAGVSSALPLTRTLFRLMDSGDVRAQTSALTLYQLLMESYRRGEESSAERIEQLIGALPGLRVVPIDGKVARQAAQVRARIGGRIERSVQLASALSEGADLFLTRHSSLRRIAGMSIESLDAFSAGPTRSG